MNKPKNGTSGKVITVMNMKGGVGKTTVAMHLAGIINKYKIDENNRGVLLIDYDPQFNLSQAFIQAKTYFSIEKKRKTTLSILVDDDSALDPFTIQLPGSANPPKVSELSHSIYRAANGKNLDIIPSTLDLMYLALGKSEKKSLIMEERFSSFIKEAKSHYDVVIIDCHPAGSLFTKTALQSSDHVLIPVVPQKFSIRGIGLMMDFINARAIASSSPTPHILFNAMPRVGTAKIEQDVRADPHFTKYCLVNTLKKYKVFTDPSEGDGFVWSSSKPYSTEAFHNLIAVSREILTRTGA